MTLTTQQKLEAITARICELIPNFSVVRCIQCEEPCPIVPCKCGSHDSYTDIEDATLEDVLVCIEYSFSGGSTVVISSTGHFGDWNGIDSGAYYPAIMWIFGKTLSEQDPSTIDWLYSLLTSSK